MHGRLEPGIQIKSHPRECFGGFSSTVCSPEARAGQVGLCLGSCITPGFRGCPNSGREDALPRALQAAGCEKKNVERDPESSSCAQDSGQRLNWGWREKEMKV